MSSEPPDDLQSEEILANESDQHDEETALSSIFPEEFRRLEHFTVYSVDSPSPKAGSRVMDDSVGDDVPLFERYTSSRLECAYEFQLMVHADIPSSQEIYLDRGSSVPPETFSGSNPITEGLWTIVKASHGMEAMWENSKGAGIIFAWQQYLAVELLPLLGLDGTILVQYWSANTSLHSKIAEGDREGEGEGMAKKGESGERGGGEEGGGAAGGRGRGEGGGTASEGGSEEVQEGWLERLRQYDLTMQQISFYSEAHVCGLCMESKAGGDFAWLGCKHYFCSACLKSMAEMHVAEGSLNSLRCPDTNCREKMQPDTLYTLLQPDSFMRWQAMHRKKELESTPGVAFCPRCDPSMQQARGRPACRNLAEGGFCKYGERCNFAHTPEEMIDTPIEPVACLPTSTEDDLYVCPRCAFSFCGGCLEPWHPGNDCISAFHKTERMEARMRYLEGQGQSDRKKAIEKMKLDLLSEKKIAMLSTACPGCKMPIEKSGGCNHMTCSSCLTHFCWKCRTAISSSDPYSHFGKGCTVFSDEDVMDANRRERMANHPNLQQRVMQAFGMQAQGGTCPNCRAQTVKEMSGNNHVTCWNCSVPFCFLCRQRLRGTHGHFKAGHPQHSNAEETRRIQEAILPRYAL